MFMDSAHFRDVSAKNIKITDANLSGLEIEAVPKLGGAYIRNIGMPPKGHPMYKQDARQRPLKFENCGDLNNSTITDCNLSGVIIEDLQLRRDENKRDIGDGFVEAI